jgi:spore germination cell wall hydrolase CwlJ-like protein
VIYPGAAIFALLNRTTPLFDDPKRPSGKALDRVARIRPATAAALFGGVVGLVIGCAYLGGVTAKSTTLRAQAERLNGATSAGFTEEALSAAAGGLDDSALAIARRHDPYTVAGGAQRDRQAALVTARLEQLRSEQGRPALRRANLTHDAARPFRLPNAIDASRDLECLTQAAYYEARGEGREGMQAVAQVVLNRVRHAAFPNSVCGVVFQGAGRSTGCQFSFTCNGAMRARVNPVAWNRARDVASKALSGTVMASVGNATHFHTTAVSPRWRNSLVRVNQVGSHLFYRFGGRSGASNAFTYAAQPSAPERPQLMQASLNPTESVRQVGQAVAYQVLVAQESKDGASAPAQPTAAARPTRPAAAQAGAAASPAPPEPRAPAAAASSATPATASAVS